MKIVIYYKHYPVAMGRYIHWGLEKAGHKVISVGPWSKGTIPWNDIQYPKRYHFPPTIELPDMNELAVEDVFILLNKNGFQNFDLLIQAADNYWLKGKAPIKNVLIGTDPHAVDYEAAKEHVDEYVSMQHFYKKDNEHWMPYGYDQDLHFYLPDTPIDWDVVFCGLQYDHRKECLKAISDAGYKVFCGLGYVYDEFVMLYNTGLIAFNWSSKNDLPARFWEGLAMRRLVLTNRVPDLQLFKDLKEDRDYLAFSSTDEAVAAVKMVMKKPDLIEKIAASGYKHVKPHTYKNRVKDMLKDVGATK